MWVGKFDFRKQLPLALKAVAATGNREIILNVYGEGDEIQKIEAKRLTDYAWSLIKNGLRSAVSIGFRSLDAEQIPNSYGLKFNKWEWLELSAVTVPAHPGATITGRKSLDGQFVTVPQAELEGAVKLLSARDAHIRDGAVSLR